MKLIGVEPAGDGGEKHGMSVQMGRVGCLHGSIQNVLCDENGNIQESHSISAGLDYPGVSPIHSYLNETKRVEYQGATDKEAIDALQIFAKMEGILPALESSHAIAYAIKMAKEFDKNDIILVNLSGRGEKDIHTVLNYLENEQH